MRIFSPILRKETIICAALWVKDDIKYVHQPTNIPSGYIIAGWRHGCCFESLKAQVNGACEYEKIQGFLTSKNRFLDRKEARDFVVKNKQLLRPEFDDNLFSEDLY